MAELGFKTVNEMIGQVQNLETRENIKHWKYSKLDLSPILYKEPASSLIGLFKNEEQDHGLNDLLDWKLLEVAKASISIKEKSYSRF